MIDRRSHTALVLGALTLLAACSTVPPPNEFEQSFEDETKTWQEVQTRLPPVPKDADLVVFAVSGATDYRFGIDAKSIDLGTDGVYRYSLVATSQQGARNISYEGIRCQTAEKKIYATGRADGTWVRSRSAAWTRIEEVGNNRQHAALMKEYFCPDGSPSYNIADVLGRLRVKLPSTIL